MFGVLELISYTYEDSVRRPQAFRKSDGVHGDISFGNKLVGYESGLEKLFATMMAIDPQVVDILHQPCTIFYRVTTIEQKLHYTPDYRIIRDASRPWIWDDVLVPMPVDCLYEVKPQEVLDKLPLKTHGAQWSLIQKIQQDAKYGFHIFTNHSIPKFQVENIMRVGNSSPNAAELAIGRECVKRLGSGSTVSVKGLAGEIAKSGLTPIPVILGLMKTRYIAGQYYLRDFLDREAFVTEL